MRYPKLFLILLFIFSNYKIFAQCNGTLGYPIVNVDFGSGANTFGPPLTSGITNYNYIAGSPNDGAYTIAKTISGLNIGWIQNIVNHTPNDANGYMMVVNANLCEGHSANYLFKATVSSDVYNNPKYQWQANTGNCWNDK